NTFQLAVSPLVVILSLKMSPVLNDILCELPRYKQVAQDLKETILANLALIGEIPAPTFGEEDRIQRVVDRFNECMLQDPSIDEIGNAMGVFPGKDRDRNILLVAHADTVFPAGTDHTLAVQSDRVVGPGVGDNSLGLAVLASLPTLIDRLDFQPEANLILLADTRSLGKGNLEGIRFFLQNNKSPIEAGLCIEGVQIGRLGSDSLGMRRGEILCGFPDDYDWAKYGQANSIITLNEVINKIVAIPTPERPATSIILGSIEGGTAYNAVPLQARLKFEIRSEDADQVKAVHRQIEDIVADMAGKTGEDVRLDIIAEREPGGIPGSHPLLTQTRDIMRELDIQAAPRPSVSELCAFIDEGIPALTLGMTKGENIHEMNSTVYIEPLFAGVAQLLGALVAIDRGLCRED
ncbi:MAG: M20/M25/M40 family metallo-hydrolase, partial [Verrucomicrobiota bacterium]